MPLTYAGESVFDGLFNEWPHVGVRRYPDSVCCLFRRFGAIQSVSQFRIQMRDVCPSQFKRCL